MLPALAVALASPAEDSTQNGARQYLFGDPLTEAVVTRGAVTTLGAVLAWHAGRFTGRRRRADTMGLAALVITQLSQTLQSAWRSRTVLGTAAISTLVLATVIETPGISQFFECTPSARPPGPWSWPRRVWPRRPQRCFPICCDICCNSETTLRHGPSAQGDLSTVS
jgi:Cation transporting ATPase, C-terminus.